MLPLRVDPTSSNFPQMRQENLLYVDKTSQVTAFLNQAKAQLFTRPRRFGKSLLLSTIEALYSGQRELFGGNGLRPELSVYREGAWHWRTHTVLRLDMQVVNDTGQGLVLPLSHLVDAAAVQLKMAGHYRHWHNDPALSLLNLIAALSERSKTTLGPARIVVLVDEYDAPVLNHMHMVQGREVRRILADFYGIFKAMDACIEKLVMTGVTRFVKTGLWSKLNQIRDQSENPRFHDLTGFTDEELDRLWAQVSERGTDPPPLEGWPPLSREAWREWYNGYRFSARSRQPVYNPFAIMSSLADGEMGEYWSQTGHLGVVESLLQDPWTQVEPQDRVPLYLTRPVPVPDYELRFDWLDDLTPGESPEAMLRQWDSRQLVPLLYQTGYLTLTPAGDLAPPNREIAVYLSRVLLDPWLAPDKMKRATLYQMRLVDALLNLNLPDMVTCFNLLLQLFPHQRFRGAFHNVASLVLDLAVLLSRNRIRYHEMEKSGLGGDADTVLGWDDIYLVLEFKTGPRESAQSGQRQIQIQGYLQALPTVARLYLGLSLYAKGGRQIEAWQCQGYSLLGEPLDSPLTQCDTWPTDKAELYRRWASNMEVGETATASE